MFYLFTKNGERKFFIFDLSCFSETGRNQKTLKKALEHVIWVLEVLLTNRHVLQNGSSFGFRL